MQEYRLFFFDGDGRLTAAHEFHAADDADAARRAESGREGRRMELWQRERKVRSWGFATCPPKDRS